MTRTHRFARATWAAALLCGALGAVAPARALSPEPWERVLRAHARDGGVDYAGLATDPAARADLDRFLAAVAEMPESEPLASWLNAYNALVVKSVLDRYPIASVRDVPGFFDRARHRAAGRMRTLDQIEHEIVRARFHDARVHVALDCGARSCPPLHGHAFVDRTLDATLDRLARRFVASDQVRVDGDGLRVSQLFEWFGDDFRRDAGSIVRWLRRYDAHHRLAAVPDGARVSFLQYDWRLNDRR